MEQTKVLVIYSGGLDSRVLLDLARSNGYEVIALSVNYGQRHSKELIYAGQVCHDLRIRHEILDLSETRHLLRGSSQTDSVPVPLGHYAEESMKATVVPNRNAIMLMHAVGWAIAEKCHAVAYGAHGGDHTIYPDCRPEFVGAMQNVIDICDWYPIDSPTGLELWAPFIGKTKADIVRLGHELAVDFTQTWTCYQGQEYHCGQCGTCVERIEAFDIAGVNDPTIYAFGKRKRKIGTIAQLRKTGVVPTPIAQGGHVNAEGTPIHASRVMRSTNFMPQSLGSAAKAFKRATDNAVNFAAGKPE